MMETDLWLVLMSTIVLIAVIYILKYILRYILLGVQRIIMPRKVIWRHQEVKHTSNYVEESFVHPFERHCFVIDIGPEGGEYRAGSKENRSCSTKEVSCLLFAKMNSIGNNCDFVLYVCECCDDTIRKVTEFETIMKTPKFESADRGNIYIGREGNLNINITSDYFNVVHDIQEIPVNDMWSRQGTLGKVPFRASLVKDLVEMKENPSLSINITVAGEEIQLKAIIATQDVVRNHSPAEQFKQAVSDVAIQSVCELTTTPSDSSVVVVNVTMNANVKGSLIHGDNNRITTIKSSKAGIQRIPGSEETETLNYCEKLLVEDERLLFEDNEQSHSDSI